MDISKRVYQRLRLIGYGTVPDFFCYSAEYRQQINRRTNPCPTPSHLPPLSKVRCCRPKKFERLPEGLLAPLRFAPHSYRPLSKVRCCRPKKFGRLPEGLFPIRTINEIFHTIPITFRTAIVCVLIWFCICTIPLAFRRVSVCVCFICFASLRNFGHTRLRHPCLACPSRCIDPLHFYNLCKRTFITCLARLTLN